MGILTGNHIKALADSGAPLVEPFVSEKMKTSGMSYGLSVAGYDVRLGEPVQFSNNDRFQLGVTLEHFRMPKDTMGFVHDKSSWARQGLSLFNTIIEPGWNGYLTLELQYFGKLIDYDLIIPAGTPIAQIIFHHVGDTEGYTGKYQNQEDKPVPFIYEDN